MADFLVSRTSPSLLADGSAGAARINGRRELVQFPWLIQAALEGKVYTAQVGSVTTPIAFTSGVAANATPELALRNPVGSGLLFVPIKMEVYWEASAGTIQECYAYVAQNDIGAGTSTAVTPINMNTLFASSNSGLTVARSYSASATTAVNPVEFWRGGFPTDIDATTAGGGTKFDWSLLQDGNVPIIGANGSLALVLGTATTATGYIIVTWAEFRTTELL